VQKILIAGLDGVTTHIGPLVRNALVKKGAQAWVKSPAAPEDITSANTFVLVPSALDRGYDSDLLAEAQLQGLRIIVLADTWYCWARLSPTDIFSVRRAIVALGSEVDPAEEAGYRDVANIIPPHWGPMYARMLANARRALDEPFVFVSGVKDTTLVNRVLQRTVEVLGNRMAVGFRPHPSEKMTPEQRAERAEILVGAKLKDCSWGNSSLPYEAQAKVVIYMGCATNSIIAAYARQSGVYVVDEESKERNKLHGCPDGEWLVQRGGMLVAKVEELETAISKLLTFNGIEELYHSQRDSFRLPQTWDTAGMVADAILAP